MIKKSLVLILGTFTAFAIFYPALAAEKQAYAEATQKIYNETVLPYLKNKEKARQYVEETYSLASDMQALVDLWAGIDELDNSRIENQTGLDFYTNDFAKIATGLRKGIDFKTPARGRKGSKDKSSNDLDVIIPAAIHTGLNDANYDSIKTNIGIQIRFFDQGTANRFSSSDPKVMEHRILNFLFLTLAVYLEGELQSSIIHSAKEDKSPFEPIHYSGRFFPRLLFRTKKQADQVWEQAIKRTINNITVAYQYGAAGDFIQNTLTARRLTEFLNHTKDQFLDWFIPIANRTNDRKHGIVRPEPIDEEARQKELEEQAKALEALMKQTAGDSKGEIKDDDIKILGRNMQEKEVKLSVSGNTSTNQVTFINIGGANIWAGKLHEQGKLAAVVPVYLLDNNQEDFSPKATGEFFIQTKQHYVVLTAREEMDKKEFNNTIKNLTSGKTINITTQTPDKDGLFAFIPAGEEGRPQFVTMAAPQGAIKQSIAYTKPDRLKNLARGISSYLTGGEGTIAARALRKTESIPVEERKVIATNFEISDLEGVGIVAKNKLIAKTVAYISDKGNLYFTAKPLRWTGKKYEEEKDNFHIKTGGALHIDGKELSDLYKDGFFQMVFPSSKATEGALFYIRTTQPAVVIAVNNEAKRLAQLSEIEMPGYYTAFVEEMTRKYQSGKKITHAF